MPATVTGLLGRECLHARIEDIKRAKGAPAWYEKLVINDQIVGTLICQPPGHPTDRHYHLTDEWWVVLEGEIDWEIEGQAQPVRARAGDFVFAPARHFHHIRPTGSGPTIRLAITPPGELHRHERAPEDAPQRRGPKRGLFVHFYSDSELKERLGGAFVPVVEPREDVMARTPPTTGAWSQWETICRRVR